MLSGYALDLAYELRLLAGPLVQNDGPSMDELKASTRLPDAALATALRELSELHFIALRDTPGGKTILLLAPLQIYLDDLENQGTDDV